MDYRGHCAQAHQGDAGKSRWQWNSRVKGLPRIGFMARDSRAGVRWLHRAPVPEPHGRVAHYRSTVQPLWKWEQRRHYCRRCSRAQQGLACHL